MPEDSKKPDDSFALLGRAPNAAIAGLWASMLEEAGIRAHVPGTYLADEWAATQRITGNVGADVFVPKSRLEEARAIVEKQPLTADEDDDALDDGEEVEGEDDGDGDPVD